MLSKLLRGSALQSAAPPMWRPAATSPVAERNAPVESTVYSEEPVLRLKTRVAELESMLERHVKESREAGYRDGLVAGKAQGSADVKPVLEKLAQSIHQLSEFRPMLRLQAEADTVRLALAIARRVVNRELNVDNESILGLVRVALTKLRTQEVMRVRIHPGQAPAIKEMLSHLSGCSHIEVSADAGIGLGGIIFETARGEFDASMEVQLNEIERGLTDRLAS